MEETNNEELQIRPNPIIKLTILHLRKDVEFAVVWILKLLDLKIGVSFYLK